MRVWGKQVYGFGKGQIREAYALDPMPSRPVWRWGAVSRYGMARHDGMVTRLDRYVLLSRESMTLYRMHARIISIV